MNMKAKGLLSAVSFLLMASCANTPGARHEMLPDEFEMETYRIRLAYAEDWSGWQVGRDDEKDTLVFEKTKIWPFNGQVQGVTTIYAMKDSVAQEGRNLTVAQHADNIRNSEEDIMRGEGPTKGRYGLQDVSRGELSLNGKQLYFLKWKATTGSAMRAGFKGEFFANGAMYLFFPPDFEKTHVLYRFLIIDSYMPGSLLPKVPMEQIYPIIDGFSVK